MTGWTDEQHGSESAASYVAGQVTKTAQALISTRPDEAPKVSVIVLVDTYDADGDSCGSMEASTNDPRSQHPMFLVRMLQEALRQSLRVAWDGASLVDESGERVRIPWHIGGDDDGES